jgi:hypothetical protein
MQNIPRETEEHPFDDAGLFCFFFREGILSITAGDEDFDVELKIQDSEEADVLLSRKFFSSASASAGGMEFARDGTGSLINSGSVKIFRGSASIGLVGTYSRINSGRVKSASGSLYFGGLRTAS